MSDTVLFNNCVCVKDVNPLVLVGSASIINVCNSKIFYLFYFLKPLSYLKYTHDCYGKSHVCLFNGVSAN